MSEDGHDLGYTTYKNGNKDGDFFQINREGTIALKGQLLYKEEFIKHDTVEIIHFLNENHDTLSSILFNGKGDDSISNSFFASTKN